MTNTVKNINALHIDEDSLMNSTTNKHHFVVELPIAMDMKREKSADAINITVRSRNKPKTIFKKKCITRYIYPTDDSCPETLIRSADFSDRNKCRHYHPCQQHEQGQSNDSCDMRFFYYSTW